MTDEIGEIKRQLEELKQRWIEKGYWNSDMDGPSWEGFKTEMAWNIYSSIRLSEGSVNE